jgi:hypothetical protein
VLSVHLHNMWVTTELLCQCRLRTYKATEEIRKDATATTKKRLWNESRSKRVKRQTYQSLVSIRVQYLGTVVGRVVQYTCSRLGGTVQVYYRYDLLHPQEVAS